MTRERPAGVLVLGMHRSGTSVATRLVNLAGPSTSIDVLGPTTWNPRGIWESASLIGLNDRLLASTGYRWWYPPPDGLRYQGATAGLDSLRPSARQDFDRVHPEVPWVWKDPRTSLLLPFWRGTLGSVIGLLVYRHPLDVAMSLDRRNAMSRRFAVALWERYTRLLLRHCQGMPLLLISYNDVVVHTMESLELLVDYLSRHGLTTGLGLDRAAAGAFVDPSLHHTVGSVAAVAFEGEFESAFELYGILDSSARVSDCFVTPDLATEAAWVSAALQWRGPHAPPEWREPP